MKALSIRQPWAWAILHAGKDIENRAWATRYRGPLLIHAAKGMSRGEYDHFANWHVADLAAAGAVLPAPTDLRRGGVIGRVDVVDCVDEHPSPWFRGHWGFVLANPVPFKAFVLMRGQLGLFDSPFTFAEGAHP